MNARPLLIASLLAASLSARGQSSSIDPTLPPESDGSSSQAASDPLHGQGMRIKTMVAVGAESGIDPGTTFGLQSGKISLSIATASTQAVAAMRSPQAPKSGYELTLLAAALMIFAAAVFLRPRAQAASPPPVPTAPGDLPFKIVRAIGEGGMGVVYEAVDQALDRRVAVKRLRDGAQDGVAGIQNLVKEAKTVAALHHPNIVDIYGVTSQGGEYYLVFEFIEGRTVETLLGERGRLTLRETKAVLDPVCAALEFAHAHGIVHRDLKPANVMITTLGQIKVMDFGIARRLQSAGGAGPAPAAPLPDHAMTNTLSGTPVYAAPEANFGLILPQSDVYSLGIMTYRMLSGALPFASDGGLRALDRSYQPLSQLTTEAPATIDALIAACLEQNPANRLASPRLFRERLAAL